MIEPTILYGLRTRIKLYILPTELDDPGFTYTDRSKEDVIIAGTVSIGATT